MFFISLQKLFSLSRKSDFRIWEIQVCWCCQMPKHRTRNTFYWLTWQVNFVLMKFDQFMPIYKRKYFIKKLHKNCDLKTCSRPFCVCKNWPQPLLKNWTVLGKLSKFVQISTDFLRFVFTEDYLKIRKGLEPHFS